MRLPSLAVVFAFAASCGTPPDTAAPAPPDASDAGSSAQDAGGCAPPVLCYPGCAGAGAGCLEGTLDDRACVCRGADGEVLPWPDGSEPVLESLRFAAALPSHVGIGSVLKFRVVARWSDGAERDVTDAATASAKPAGLLEVESAGRARGKAGGTATLEARWSDDGREKSIEATLQVRAEEARAVWVTRYEYGTDATAGPASIRALVHAAADANFNVVLFQVRAEADAYYRSGVEPWSRRLAGLGADPGWDPLQVALETAHARGIELHAYLNVFTGWPPAAGASGPGASAAGAPAHVMRAHPEWIDTDAGGNRISGDANDGYWWLSPAVEGVRRHNAEVVRDLLARYPVDGVHLDRVRYVGTDFGRTEAAQAEYRARWGADDTHWDEFRVEAVNDQVRRIYDVVREVRPGAKLSAAVWGIYEKLHPSCSTSQGLRDYLQDSLAWTEGGYIDALAPMIYWPVGSGRCHTQSDGTRVCCTDYARLLEAFLRRRGDRQVWGGMKVADSSGFSLDTLAARIAETRRQPASGFALYSSGDLKTGNRWSLLGGGLLREPAPPPTTTWR